MLEDHRKTFLKICVLLQEALQQLQKKYPDAYQIRNEIESVKKMHQNLVCDGYWEACVFTWDHQWLPSKRTFIHDTVSAVGMLYGIRQVERYWGRNLTPSDIAAVDTLVKRTLYPNGYVYSETERNGDRVLFIACDLSEIYDRLKKVGSKKIKASGLAKLERYVTVLAIGRQKSVQTSAVV